MKKEFVSASELAKEKPVSCNKSKIIYYIKTGLLNVEGKFGNHYLLKRESSIERLIKIKELQEKGKTNDEIKEILKNENN